MIFFSPLVNGAHSARFFNKCDFKQALMFVCPIEADPKLTMPELYQLILIWASKENKLSN